MRELWEHATLSYNLPLTILMGLVLVYWLLCIVGLLGMDTIGDFFDGSPSGPAPGAEDSSWLRADGMFPSMVRYLNAADVPLVVVLSFISLFLWGGSMLLNYYFNPSRSDWMASLLLIPNIPIALVLTRIATSPIGRMLRKINSHTIAELDGEGGYLINAKLPPARKRSSAARVSL
jgi:hypothetical protein